MSESPFHKELTGLLNSHSMENGSNTPDFILATYMLRCLDAFDEATRSRETWYGRGNVKRCDGCKQPLHERDGCLCDQQEALDDQYPPCPSCGSHGECYADCTKGEAIA